MRFRSFINEGIKIRVTSFCSFGPFSGTTGFDKDEILDVIKFDEKNNAIVWAPKLSGIRRVAIPHYQYEILK